MAWLMVEGWGLEMEGIRSWEVLEGVCWGLEDLGTGVLWDESFGKCGERVEENGEEGWRKMVRKGERERREGLWY